MTTQVGTKNFGPIYDAENNNAAMTPILFCASFAPCVKLSSADEASCECLKKWSFVFSEKYFAMAETILVIKNPANNPRNGENTMASMMIVNPFNCKADMPLIANAAPTKPPIREWDELDGNPKYHVIIFHAVALTNATKISNGDMILGSISPVPIVFAMESLKNKNAIKLKNAAHRTACFGVNTPVETTVAIEFAAS